MKQLKHQHFTFPAGCDGLWRPYNEDDDGSEHTVVTVLAINNGYRIECEQYYGRDWVCKLEITQPLNRALATFGALLVEDAKQEARNRA